MNVIGPDSGVYCNYQDYSAEEIFSVRQNFFSLPLLIFKVSLSEKYMVIQYIYRVGQFLLDTDFLVFVVWIVAVYLICNKEIPSLDTFRA